jgi:hypothetical protein
MKEDGSRYHPGGIVWFLINATLTYGDYRRPGWLPFLNPVM